MNIGKPISGGWGFVAPPKIDTKALKEIKINPNSKIFETFENFFIWNNIKINTIVLITIAKPVSLIIKPIESYGGNDVKLLNKFHKEKILKYIKKYSHLMFQKFIPQISKGDKRIFIINGKVKGSISRVPKLGSILSNMSKGAKAKEIKITPHELKISKFVASELKKSNIYFAGIDFINGKLIGDINVTSPTGLKTYYDLTGINLAEYFFDNIWEDLI